MNLYLIERKRSNWDEYVSAVIAATTPKEAREIAALALTTPYGSYRTDWTNSTRSSLSRIGLYAGPRVRAHVVHAHFQAG